MVQGWVHLLLGLAEGELGVGVVGKGRGREQLILQWNSPYFQFHLRLFTVRPE